MLRAPFNPGNEHVMAPRSEEPTAIGRAVSVGLAKVYLHGDGRKVGHQSSQLRSKVRPWVRRSRTTHAHPEGWFEQKR